MRILILNKKIIQKEEYIKLKYCYTELVSKHQERDEDFVSAINLGGEDSINI